MDLSRSEWDRVNFEDHVDLTSQADTHRAHTNEQHERSYYRMDRSVPSVQSYAESCPPSVGQSEPDSFEYLSSDPEESTVLNSVEQGSGQHEFESSMDMNATSINEVLKANKGSSEAGGCVMWKIYKRERENQPKTTKESERPYLLQSSTTTTEELGSRKCISMPDQLSTDHHHTMNSPYHLATSGAGAVGTTAVQINPEDDRLFDQNTGSDKLRSSHLFSHMLTMLTEALREVPAGSEEASQLCSAAPPEMLAAATQLALTVKPANPPQQRPVGLENILYPPAESFPNEGSNCSLVTPTIWVELLPECHSALLPSGATRPASPNLLFPSGRSMSPAREGETDIDVDLSKRVFNHSTERLPEVPIDSHESVEIQTASSCAMILPQRPDALNLLSYVRNEPGDYRARAEPNLEEHELRVAHGLHPNVSEDGCNASTVSNQSESVGDAFSNDKRLHVRKFATPTNNRKNAAANNCIVNDGMPGSSEINALITGEPVAKKARIDTQGQSSDMLSNEAWGRGDDMTKEGSSNRRGDMPICGPSSRMEIMPISGPSKRRDSMPISGPPGRRDGTPNNDLNHARPSRSAIMASLKNKALQNCQREHKSFNVEHEDVTSRPVQMSEAEREVLQRRRHSNKLSAQRSRARKQGEARISEELLKSLKEKNAELRQEVQRLKEEIRQIRQYLGLPVCTDSTTD